MMKQPGHLSTDIMLKVVDLQTTPLPYADNVFDHVICCGVFHFFDALETILQEVLLVIKPGGSFAFTVAAQTSLTLHEQPMLDNQDTRILYIFVFLPAGANRCLMLSLSVLALPGCPLLHPSAI